MGGSKLETMLHGTFTPVCVVEGPRLTNGEKILLDKISACHNKVLSGHIDNSPMFVAPLETYFLRV